MASILDRDGIPLAVSDDAVAIAADPQLTAPIAQQLAAILSGWLPAMSYDQIVTLLVRPDSRYVVVARKVSPRDVGEHPVRAEGGSSSAVCTPSRTPSGHIRAGRSRRTWSASSVPTARVSAGSSTA